MKRFINRRRYVILALLLVIEVLLGGVALASVFSESVRIMNRFVPLWSRLCRTSGSLCPSDAAELDYEIEVAAAVSASAFGLYVGILVPTAS